MDEERSVCDDCERGDAWECQFCCDKCYEDYGECPNPDCDPYRRWGITVLLSRLERLWKQKTQISNSAKICKKCFYIIHL